MLPLREAYETKTLSSVGAQSGSCAASAPVISGSSFYRSKNPITPAPYGLFYRVRCIHGIMRINRIDSVPRIANLIYCLCDFSFISSVQFMKDRSIACATKTALAVVTNTYSVHTAARSKSHFSISSASPRFAATPVKSASMRAQTSPLLRQTQLRFSLVAFSQDRATNSRNEL